jgi:hypothetical protein
MADAQTSRSSITLSALSERLGCSVACGMVLSAVADQVVVFA